VALNEQFMVALLPANLPTKDKDGPGGEPRSENRVVSVLMRRLGSTRTFGENLIFMLNRAGKSPWFAIHIEEGADVEFQGVRLKTFACNSLC